MLTPEYESEPSLPKAEILNTRLKAAPLPVSSTRKDSFALLFATFGIHEPRCSVQAEEEEWLGSTIVHRVRTLWTMLFAFSLRNVFEV